MTTDDSALAPGVTVEEAKPRKCWDITSTSTVPRCEVRDYLFGRDIAREDLPCGSCKKGVQDARDLPGIRLKQRSRDLLLNLPASMGADGPGVAEVPAVEDKAAVDNLISHGLLEHPPPHEPVEGPYRRRRSAVRRTPLGDLVVERLGGLLRQGGRVRWASQIDALVDEVEAPFEDLCELALENSRRRQRMTAQGSAGPALDEALAADSAAEPDETQDPEDELSESNALEDADNLEPKGLDAFVQESVRRERREHLEVGRAVCQARASSGFGSVAELAKRHGVSPRVLTNRAVIFDRYVTELGVDPDRLTRVNEGTLLALKDVATRENVERLLALAENETVTNIRKATCPRGKLTRVSFDLDEGQLSIVTTALAEVRRLSRTKTQAEQLANACLRFTAYSLDRSVEPQENPKVEPRTLMWHMDRAFGGKFVWISDPTEAKEVIDYMRERTSLFAFSESATDTVERERVEALRREIERAAQPLDGVSPSPEQSAAP